MHIILSVRPVFLAQSGGPAADKKAESLTSAVASLEEQIRAQQAEYDLLKERNQVCAYVHNRHCLWPSPSAVNACQYLRMKLARMCCIQGALVPASHGCFQNTSTTA